MSVNTFQLITQGSNAKENHKKMEPGEEFVLKNKRFVSEGAEYSRTRWEVMGLAWKGFRILEDCCPLLNTF